MTAPTTTRSGSGFRHCQVLALNAAGYPNTTDTNAYSGVTLEGAKTLTINDPEPKQIAHTGDDGVFALDTLPPTEPISGEIHSGKINDALDAILTPDKSFTIGEAKLFPIGSNNRGLENQVAVIAYRQTKATGVGAADSGSRRWEFKVFPKATLVPREPGYTADPEDKTYTFRPDYVAKHLWGLALSAATEGCTLVQGFRGISAGRPYITSFQGNNTLKVFVLPTSPAPNDATKIAVWVDGVLQTTCTATITSLTFGTTPGTAANIVCFYEY
jgi:hypothetical protein